MAWIILCPEKDAPNKIYNDKTEASNDALRHNLDTGHKSKVYKLIRDD